MIFLRRLTILTLCALVTLSCDSDPEGASFEVISYQTYVADSQFQVSASGTLVIRDQEQWQRFYHKFGTTDEIPTPPDFSQNMVIGIFWGPGYSGCTHIADGGLQVSRTGTQLRVLIGEPSGLGDCEALVSPLQLIVVPKFDQVLFTGLVPEPSAGTVFAPSVPEHGGFFITRIGTEVIRDETHWRRLWEDYWTISDADGPTPPPEINFEEEMVVAAFWGDDYSGCDNAVPLIEKVEESCPLLCGSNTIMVHLKPLPDDLGPCRAVIAPIHMVRIPKSDAPVVFVGAVPGQ